MFFLGVFLCGTHDFFVKKSGLGSSPGFDRAVENRKEVGGGGLKLPLTPRAVVRPPPSPTYFLFFSRKLLGIAKQSLNPGASRHDK